MRTNIQAQAERNNHPQRRVKQLGLAFVLSSFVAAGVLPVAAVPTPITVGTTYSQDFNTLATSGTSSTVPAGWEFVETGNNANTTYTADDGNNNAGDTYSYGTGTTTDRAFGGIQVSQLLPLIGVGFNNTGPSAINVLAVSYTGEEWRLGTGSAGDRLDFQYSLNASSITTGTWTDVNTLDFSTPNLLGGAGAKDGNLAANRTSISDTITGLNIAPGAQVWFRWVDNNASGQNDGLSVDDFSLTPRTTSTVPAVPDSGSSLLLLGMALTGLGWIRRHRTA